MRSSAYSENSFAKTAFAIALALMAGVAALGLALAAPQEALAEQLSASTPVTLAVDEGDVAGISFTPANPYELVEAADGDWVSENEGDGEFVYYSAPSFAKGDTLTLIKADETQVTYVYGLPRKGSDYDYDASDYAFVSEDNSIINEDDVRFKQAENQYQQHWYAGEQHAFTLTYSDMSCKVPITIVDNPVKSIELKPVKRYQLIEDIDEGLWYSKYDYDTGQTIDYYYYAMWPDFHESDVLEVTASDGQVTDYTYHLNRTSDSVSSQFVAENGATISMYEIKQYLGQDGLWEAGSTHSMRLTYKGRRCTADIDIVKNPVNSISFTPITPYELAENVDGFWPSGGGEDGWDDEEESSGSTDYFHYRIPKFQEGDKLTVTDADGNETDYFYQKTADIDGYETARFISSAGDAIETEDAYTNFNSTKTVQSYMYQTGEWTVGNTYSFQVRYMKATCDVPVTIVEGSSASAFDAAEITLSGTSFTYTGKAIEPAVNVVLDGKTLTAGSDYSVAYSNNTDAGTGTVTITGAGIYAGTTNVKATSFSILPAEQVISAPNLSVAYGKTAQLSAKISSGDGTLSYAISDAKVATVDKNGKVTPKKVGTATITVSASATRNFALSTKTVKVTVTKGANSFAAKLVKATQTVKSGKKTTIAASKAFKVAKNASKGKVTYKKTSGNSKIKISSAGKVTVNKGLKKGKYTVKVKLTSAATTNYNSASKTLSLKIKVK